MQMYFYLSLNKFSMTRVTKISVGHEYLNSVKLLYNQEIVFQMVICKTWTIFSSLKVEYILKKSGI